MVIPQKRAEENQRLSPAERHAYMELPLEARRELLAARAEAMIKHYEQEPERRERLAWQGGDIVEPDQDLSRNNLGELNFPPAQRAGRT